MFDKKNGPILRTAFNAVAPNGQLPAAAAINMGTIPGSRMAASAFPANADTVTIGGKVFTCVTALGAAAANLQFLRGGSAAATYANLVDAINGKASTQGSTWVEATTPFALALVADMVTATQLRLRFATARGGLAQANVSGSVVLAASITAGAAAWTNANLNTIGKLASDVQQAYGAITVTAAMITATFIDVELEFQPTLYDIFVVTSAGVQKVITEVVTIPASQTSLHITTGTGATPLIAGDVLNYWAGA